MSEKWMRRTKRFAFVMALLTIIYVILAIPEWRHVNTGESRSIGSVGNGRLENAWLVPYSGKNFRFFSGLSYFVCNNGYTHSATCRTIVEAYKICETTCPGICFKLGECSDRHGGKMRIHRTHQNGMSADFMVPKKRGTRVSSFFDYFGYFHYLFDFDDEGRLYLQKSVNIDFETMARHILALDKAAHRNGQRIRQVILKLELKDEFFATPSGQKVRERGIYFAQNLPYWTNRVHDDHYHVDFELL